MKTLQELYDEVMKSDELKKAFAEAAKANQVADFLKAQNCDATAEELNEFLAEKAGEDLPLSPDELEAVAGGGHKSALTSACNTTKSCSSGCTKCC